MTDIFNPLVSIVIPVYNGSNYIIEAIDSALTQTYKNIEVIVVNDGSKDDGKTEQIAKSYGNKIRYFKKENGGVSTALNLGIRKMKGEYFAWLSHDDVYYKDKIEKQISFLHKTGNNECILYGDIEFINDYGENISFLRVSPKSDNNYEPILFGYINGCTILINKNCLKKSGIFCEYLYTAQDYDMWFRLAKDFNFKHIPYILAKSRIHFNQGSRSRKFIIEGDNLYKRIIKELQQSEFEEIELDYNNFFSHFTLFLIKMGYLRASKLAETKMKEYNIYSIKERKIYDKMEYVYLALMKIILKQKLFRYLIYIFNVIKYRNWKDLIKRLKNKVK